MNCHGCKWLDEEKSQPKGSGYCCQVVRSKTQNKKARYSYMERCELYEQGDFATRYGKEKTAALDLVGETKIDHPTEKGGETDA